VREDPDREGLLYAGTEFGIFISFDNGAHWQSFQQNLPNVPVADLKLHNQDLIVATQGRAFWILDNVSSLHQITPQVVASEAHLYAPRDGYRTRAGAGLLGPNIEYYLASEPGGPVTIEILDAAGEMVNTYGSGDSAAISEDRRGGRGRRAAAPPSVTASAGHNRFVWDVQNSSGLGAPPGEYEARLKVGDTTLAQPFTVLIDPRIAAEGVTVADLREQFEHNTRMYEMVAEVRALQERVKEAKEMTEGENRARIDGIAAKLETEPVRYGKPGLQAQISYLARMTTRVDQKIGRDAIERYYVLRAELDAITSEVDRVLGPEG